MASCFGLGVYHQFWRKGALIQARVTDVAERERHAAAAAADDDADADADADDDDDDDDDDGLGTTQPGTTRLPGTTLLLIELESTEAVAHAYSHTAGAPAWTLGLTNPEPLGVNEADMHGAPPAHMTAAPEHTLACTLRGPAEAIEELCELLAQVASEPLTKSQSASNLGVPLMTPRSASLIRCAPVPTSC
jgi:hypothetical protein